MTGLISLERTLELGRMSGATGWLSTKEDQPDPDKREEQGRLVG